MSLTELMNRQVGIGISTSMQMFIYDLICLNEYTDDDIETVKDYESAKGEDVRLIIDELIVSCKVFKAKYVLMKKDLPPASNIEMTVERVPGRINPKVTLKELTPKP